MTQLTLVVCECAVEVVEVGGLPETLRTAVDDEGVWSKENRVKALDLLCWLASVHCNSSDRWVWL